MKTFRKWIVLGVCLAFFGLVNAPEAQAAFKLRLSSGGNDVTITDQDFLGGVYAGGPGGTQADANVAPGIVSFVGTVGNFTINLTSGVGDPALPNTATSAQLDLISFNATSSAGGTLLLELTQTGLTLDPTPAIILRSMIGGTLGTTGTLSAEQILDLGNAEFAVTGDAEVDHGPFGPGGAFSGTGEDVTGPYTGTPFSITERVVLTHVGANASSFDFHSTATVPVPPTVILCLSGLPMFVGSWWVRRRRSTKSA